MLRADIIQKKCRDLWFCPLTIVLCILLAGCTVDIAAGSYGSTNGTTTCLADCTVGSGAHGLKLFVEPDAGDKVITNAIAGAKQSVWVKIYLLTNRNVIEALEEAAHRGLDVRVMLEVHPYGGGSISPTETMDRLKAAGVKTQAANPRFALTHEKSMIIDARTAYIMTANFTLSALGGSKSTTNREYGLIDTNVQDVQSVIDLFNADWNREDVQVNNPNMVVSPINARHTFVALISSAHKTLQVEAEEMQDEQIEQELINAARRGVQVSVILPPSQGSDDHNNEGVNAIKQGGVQVRRDAKLYMHAKIIIVDGQKAFVGSENISSASLDKNRELGLLVADRQVMSTLQGTFQRDWRDSRVG
ncbi:MAG: hypothetical protein J2P37_03645 [Ktedonobacteraceae bacterium]|nr:hypothetical protein [Ktedonobacteraceae bacterium]